MDLGRAAARTSWFARAAIEDGEGTQSARGADEKPEFLGGVQEDGLDPARVEEGPGIPGVRTFQEGGDGDESHSSAPKNSSQRVSCAKRVFP